MQNETPRATAGAWGMVFILMLAYVLSFVDRQILNLLVKPIRADLGISDTQMSLLMGLSFAVFYTACGIPLARLADRAHRGRLIAAGMVLWSAATAACGLASQYVHLFLARIGVGVGEAALSPAAYSLITDRFPKEQRATAASVYSMGIYLGSGLAFLVGGLVIGFAAAHGDIVLPLLGTVRPWQTVFLVLGVIGIVFGLLLLGLSEPRRVAPAASHGYGDFFALLKTHRSILVPHNLGFALVAMASYSSSAWVPSYFIRVYGWSAQQTGYIYGVIVTIFGAGGILFAGWLADRLIKRGVTDATLRVPLYASLIALPCYAALALVTDAQTATLLLIPATFCMSMPFGVGPAGLQEVVPPTLRAQAVSVYLLVVNLIGLGIGPTAVALLTDKVFGDDNAVGYSLAVICSVALLGAALCLQLARAPYRARVAGL